MTTEQKLQWVAVPGGLLPDGRLKSHGRDVAPAAHRRGHHLGGLPRPARLAGHRGGRDLDCRRRRRRPAGRGRQPGAGVRPVGGALPARDAREAVGVPRPGGPADGDVRRDEGACPAQAPLRPGCRLVAGRAAVAAIPTRRRSPGAGSGRAPVRGGPARSDHLRRAGTPTRHLAALPIACCRPPARRPRRARRPVPAADPRSIRCRRRPRSRSSEPRCSTPRPRRSRGRCPPTGSTTGPRSTSTRWSAASGTTPTCCVAWGSSWTSRSRPTRCPPRRGS